MLVALAVVSLAARCAIGVGAAIAWGYGLLAFVVVGAVLVPAYNLELALPQRRRASRSPGARFPALTGYFVEAQTLRLEAIAAAVYAFALSLAQRALSTPVRRARREARHDGGIEPLERALRLLTLGGRRARRRARGGAPTMNGVTAAAIIAIVAASSRSPRSAAACSTLRRVRAPAEHARARDRARQGRVRRGRRARGSSSAAKSSSACSPGCGRTRSRELAEEERRIAEERRRDVAERERDASARLGRPARRGAARRRAAPRRLGHRRREAAGGPDRRAEARRGTPAAADGRDRVAHRSGRRGAAEPDRGAAPADRTPARRARRAPRRR